MRMRWKARTPQWIMTRGRNATVSFGRRRTSTYCVGQFYSFRGKQNSFENKLDQKDVVAGFSLLFPKTPTKPRVAAWKK